MRAAHHTQYTHSHTHTPSTSDYNEMKYTEKEDENSAQFNLAAHSTLATSFWSTNENNPKRNTINKRAKKRSNEKRIQQPNKSKWNEDQRQKCEQKCVSLESMKLCALWMMMMMIE